MPDNHEARLSKLEKKAVKVEEAIQKLKDDVKGKATKTALAKVNQDLNDVEKDIKLIQKWIKMEVQWSQQVTAMLRMIDWDLLATDYPGGGGTNPPQTPPVWPPEED